MKATLIVCLLCVAGLSSYCQQESIILNYRAGYKVPLVVNMGRTLNPADDTRPVANEHPELLADSVGDFSAYFDDKLIDSFWREFKNISSDKNADASSDEYSMIQLTPIERQYLIVFKMMYGESFFIEQSNKFIVKDTLRKIDHATMRCWARSSRAKGLIDVGFRMMKDRTIRFEWMNFLPFDNSPNAFLSGLAEGDIFKITSGKGEEVIDTMIHYADSSMIASLSRQKPRLSKVKPLNLFSSRFTCIIARCGFWASIPQRDAIQIFSSHTDYLRRSLSQPL